MTLLWWNGRVPVRGDSPGVSVMVGDVQRTAEMLLGWPQKGPLWKRGVQACMDAMEGRITPDEARDAFREAAAEEGMYLRNLEVTPALQESGRPTSPRNR